MYLVPKFTKLTNGHEKSSVCGTTFVRFMKSPISQVSGPNQLLITFYAMLCILIMFN
jgi:hypothetical protein